MIPEKWAEKPPPSLPPSPTQFMQIHSTLIQLAEKPPSLPPLPNSCKFIQLWFSWLKSPLQIHSTFWFSWQKSPPFCHFMRD